MIANVKLLHLVLLVIADILDTVNDRKLVKINLLNK